MLTHGEDHPEMSNVDVSIVFIDVLLFHHTHVHVLFKSIVNFVS